MNSIELLVKQFYETSEYDSWSGEKERNPKVINSGICGEFANFVVMKEPSFDKITTADVVGVPRKERPDPWHVWVTDGEKHYDAEKPSGVEQWTSLPYFKRNL